MSKQPRILHLVVGSLGLVIFLLTGYLMRFHMHDLMEANIGFRIALRGNHIYILMLSLLNIALGAYLKVNQTIWRAWLQLVGSLMILAATIQVIINFFFENKIGLERPLTLLAVILALTGTLFHAISGLQRKFDNQ